jgi:hypothetical protein
MSPHGFITKLFQRRGATEAPLEQALPLGVVLTPEIYTRHAIGGSGYADVLLSGPEQPARTDGPGHTRRFASARLDHIIQAQHYIGMLCQISHQTTGHVWNGWVEKVILQLERRKITIDLEPMANMIAVRYDDGTQTRVTAYANHIESIERFGPKMRIYDIDGTAAQALAYRDALIVDPLVVFPRVTKAHQTGQLGAILECRGDFDLLDWTFAAPSDLSTGIGANITPQVPVPVGTPGARSLAARVDNPTALPTRIDAITFKLGKNGTPPPLLAKIRAWDGTNTPTDQTLASITIDAGSIADGGREFTVTFPDGITIAPFGAIWYSLETLTYSEANYYTVGLATAEDDLSTTFLTEAGWAPLIGALATRLSLSQAISAQIGELLDSVPWIRTIDNDVDTSTGFAPILEASDVTVKDRLLALLNGRIAGRRVLLTLQPDRSARLTTQQPYQERDALIEQADGTLFSLGQRIAPQTCPAGAWLVDTELLAYSGRGLQLIDGAHSWIEESEYSLEDGWKVTK